MKSRYDTKKNTAYETSRVKHLVFASTIFLFLILLISAFACLFQDADAADRSEITCLSRIMWAEAQGESFTGIAAVAEATVIRAKEVNSRICKLKGVKSKPVPSNVRRQLDSLASSIIDKRPTILKKSNSWNKGRIPFVGGKIERVIGKHVFYQAEK